MATVGTSRSGPRERLLATATELFAAHGVHAIGIDRLLREAGVAKASMYAAFASKDELVAAYVRRLDARDRRRWTDAVAHVAAPTERVLAFYDLALAHQAPEFRGCRYLAVASSYTGTTTPGGRAVLGAVAEHRAWVTGTITDLLDQAGYQDPAGTLAARLVLLYDGALAGAKLAQDAAPLRTARDLVVTLLDR